MYLFFGHFHFFFLSIFLVTYKFSKWSSLKLCGKKRTFSAIKRGQARVRNLRRSVKKVWPEFLNLLVEQWKIFQSEMVLIPEKLQTKHLVNVYLSWILMFLYVLLSFLTHLIGWLWILVKAKWIALEKNMNPVHFWWGLGWTWYEISQLSWNLRHFPSLFLLSKDT